MKPLLAILLLVSSYVHAEEFVRTDTLTPIVTISDEEMRVKDTRGNKWVITTDCSVKTDDITEFTVQSRAISKDTKIKIAKDRVCHVYSVAKL